MPVTLSKTSLVLLALSSGLAVFPFSAQAVMPDAAAIQTQLQNEWSRFAKTLGPAITTKGNIAVSRNGMSYKATLPDMTVQLQDRSTLQFSPITVQATPDGSGVINLDITLPSSVPQYMDNKKIGALTIGSQTVKATVQPSNTAWQIQSLNGTVKNVQWKNTVNALSASIGQVTLNGQPEKLQIQSQNIATTDVLNTKTTIDSLAVVQKAMTGQTMRLSDVLSLFTLITPQTASMQGFLDSWMSGSAGGNAMLKNFKTVYSDGKTNFTIADAQLQSAITGIANNLITMKTLGNISGIQIASASSLAPLLPKTIDFSGTIRNLPADYFALPLGTENGQQTARAKLAASNAQMQIDSLDIVTASGLKADSMGLLMANSIPPNYLAGNLDLTLINLPAAMALLQKQISSGKAAANSGPAMMALMMLQGIGKPVNNDANQILYNIVFSPTGEMLVNGQNVSALASLAGMGKGGAIPPVPVPTTAVTPLKKP